MKRRKELSNDEVQAKAAADDAASRARLQDLLESLPLVSPDDPAGIRARMRHLAEVLFHLRRLAKAQGVNLKAPRGASGRILAYLNLFVGETVSGRELEVVSGIQDFPRRIRELRRQRGYLISSGVTREDLRPNEYVLETVDPDVSGAEKWKTANNIRRQGGSAQSRMLALLKAYMGQPVSTEAIAYVAPGKDKRRVRELRTDEGYRVVTRHTGRPDLPGGVYVLESLDQLPAHDRKIPDSTYDAILVRDEQRCRRCGWSVSDRTPAARKQFLEVHHVEHYRDGGRHNQENLVTLCNVDHDDVHRRDLKGEPFWEWLRSRT